MSNQKRTESRSIFDDGTRMEAPTPWMIVAIVVFFLIMGALT